MSYPDNSHRSFPPSPYRPIVSQLITLCTITALVAGGAVAAVIATLLTGQC